jgi:hypothetical protein
MNILANPGSETDLIWGNPNGLSLSKVYAAPGQDKLISFTSMNGSFHLSYFLSGADLTDLVIEKVAHPEIKDAMDMTVEGDPSGIPVFFALLDLYRESQLKAALERRQDFQVLAAPEEINRIFQEAKLENNLSWYSPAGYLTMTNDTDLSESGIIEAINKLKHDGIIGTHNELVSRFTTFTNCAFPLVAFMGIKVITSIEKTQIALFRGISSLLFLELTSENNVNRVSISSIGTSELPGILTSLTARLLEVELPSNLAFQSQVAPNPVVCAKCGNSYPGGTKFCAKCGVQLSVTAGAKYCTKCGKSIKIGGQFCDKCGTRIH